ncbi:hypothetical protein BU24DRAFT_417512 [Aaosphaeria arxii CBS 175.79]|uniref:Uncharacterized protein n=1 Tax=Aaosphaeria arxii CBS 175.79 TaxID=1450172 RepID=A0A6A5Y8Y6_9PLEO|nr:uncharacterized protein BU24DRAFT_417512 [Aaosphaeria arxii CBS 175.79]KAF2021878.1 hypothetical protein BU24DRAFT_417512 [Aaosphaeria arxii CBS 175.79]
MGKIRWLGVMSVLQTKDYFSACVQHIQRLLGNISCHTNSAINYQSNHFPYRGDCALLALRNSFVPMIGTLIATSSGSQRTRCWVCAGSTRLECDLTFDQVGGYGVTG